MSHQRPPVRNPTQPPGPWTLAPTPETQVMSSMTQAIKVKLKAHGGRWTEFELLTGRSDDLDSRTTVRSPDDAEFFDISIEEYTGISRRAKFTSVRFEGDAARLLYEVLKAKFTKDIA